MFSDITSAIHFVGTMKPLYPTIGDTVINDKNMFIYNGTNWIDIGEENPTINTKIEYRELIPKICSRCGATLHSNICEYCGTEYY